ncbi:8508_t:CDS:1, partial [Racocetra persica]
LDRWSSPANELLYNFIISTPDRKEYLYAILDFSDAIQTGEFLSSQIFRIVDKVDTDKFIACITDNGSNARIVREITMYNYLHIWNIRCVAYVLNLIASDIVKIPSVSSALKRANQ